MEDSRATRLERLRSQRFDLLVVGGGTLDEVRALSEVVAPHLVRPLRFVLPVYRGGPYGRIPIRGALWSYAGLTGSISQRGRNGRAVGGGRARPDDARLTLANVRGAEDAGAVVLNRAEGRTGETTPRPHGQRI